MSEFAWHGEETLVFPALRQITWFSVVAKMTLVIFTEYQA